MNIIYSPAIHALRIFAVDPLISPLIFPLKRTKEPFDAGLALFGHRAEEVPRQRGQDEGDEMKWDARQQRHNIVVLPLDFATHLAVLGRCVKHTTTHSQEWG